MSTTRWILLLGLGVVLLSAHDTQVRGFDHWCVSPYGYSYSYPAGGYYAGPVYYGARQLPQQAYAGPEYQARGYGDRQAQGARVVRMTDRARFEPAQITVAVGESVEWRNTSSQAHTVTANPELAANSAHVVVPQGAAPFHSGEIAPGGRYSYTFDVPGIYYYVCLPHEEMGMVGIVVVRPQRDQVRRAGGSAPGGAGRGY